MTFHDHRTPRPAAAPPAARPHLGPVTLALRAMTPPPPTGPVTAAIRALRAADPQFDRSPDLKALREALAVLDAIDGDADLEPSLGGSDWYDGITRFDLGGTDDCEDGGDDEDGSDDEPALGSLDETADRMSQDDWAAGGSEDLERDDDNGIGDAAGLAEQTGVIIATGSYL